MSGIILWWSVIVYCNCFCLFVNKSKEVKKKGGDPLLKEVFGAVVPDTVSTYSVSKYGICLLNIVMFLICSFLPAV